VTPHITRYSRILVHAGVEIFSYGARVHLRGAGSHYFNRGATAGMVRGERSPQQT
jgi:hypothetical protein